MNKLVIAGLASLAALGLAPVAANAQSVDVQKPVTIKLGIFLPSNGTVKNKVGSTFFAAGLEFGLSKTTADQATIPLLYVDYNGDSKSGQHLYDTGVGVGVKHYLGSADASSSPYVGAGVGAYFDQASLNGSSENKTNLGFKLDVGYEFSHAALIEADYVNAGSAAGVSADGFDILVGYRF
jgi:outer membrane protein W